MTTFLVLKTSREENTRCSVDGNCVGSKVRRLTFPRRIVLGHLHVANLGKQRVKASMRQPSRDLRASLLGLLFWFRSHCSQPFCVPYGLGLLLPLSAPMLWLRPFSAASLNPVPHLGTPYHFQIIPVRQSVTLNSPLRMEGKIQVSSLVLSPIFTTYGRKGISLTNAAVTGENHDSFSNCLCVPEKEVYAVN